MHTVLCSLLFVDRYTHSGSLRARSYARRRDCVFDSVCVAGVGKVSLFEGKRVTIRRVHNVPSVLLTAVTTQQQRGRLASDKKNVVHISILALQACDILLFIAMRQLGWKALRWSRALRCW